MLDPNLANHPSQRVGIFIDTQNLYHSAKANYRSTVNYEEMIYTAVNGRQLVRAFAYVIKSENTDEEKFFDALADIGIEIRIKDIQIFYTGEKKADWDVGIAVDIIRMTEKLDTIVLVSGDGDFIEVIKYVKSRGVRAEIMAFKKTTSLKLVEEADFFYDLGAEPERFLINPRSYSKGVSRKLIASKNVAPLQNYPLTQQPSLSPKISQTSSFFKASPRYSAAKENKSAPSFLKPATPTKNFDDSVYGKKIKRHVKPVVGLPVKKNYSSRFKSTTPTNSNLSADNAFGNKRVVKKLPASKPVSSIFGKDF